MRQTAILGGSFNPPHVAHVMAAYWTLATQGVSEVWMLPSFRHPFGNPFGIGYCLTREQADGDGAMSIPQAKGGEPAALHPDPRARGQVPAPE